MNKHKQIDISAAKCSRLSFDSPVQLLRQEKSKELAGFDIQAYTGAVVDRWWGRLAIAVDGIQAKQQMPIFLNHDQTKIVGYSTGHQAGQSFSVQGVFSTVTESAAEVKALAAEGFPWQASIGVTPLTILEIRENTSTVVNGQTVQGPAEVWLQSQVHETSFVALGADGSTGVTVFSECEQRAVKPTTNHTQEQKMDLAQLKTEHPDLVVALSAEIVAGLKQEDLTKGNQDLEQQLLTRGAQLERERIADVRAQSIPGHEGLVAKLELDGASTGADAAKAIIAAEKLMRTQAGAQLEQQANAPATIKGDPIAENGPKTMKRAEFNKFSAVEQGNIIQSGVKLVD